MGYISFSYANVVRVLHKSHVTAVIWHRVRERAKHTPLILNQVQKKMRKAHSWNVYDIRHI